MYVLTVGWQKFGFSSLIEATNAMGTLHKALPLETAYLKENLVMYGTKVELCLEIVAATDLDYPDYKALTAAREALQETPQSEDA